MKPSSLALLLVISLAGLTATTSTTTADQAAATSAAASATTTLLRSSSSSSSRKSMRVSRRAELRRSSMRVTAGLVARVEALAKEMGQTKIAADLKASVSASAAAEAKSRVGAGGVTYTSVETAINSLNTVLGASSTAAASTISTADGSISLGANRYDYKQMQTQLDTIEGLLTGVCTSDPTFCQCAAGFSGTPWDAAGSSGFDLQFFFGTALPASAASDAVLDVGTSDQTTTAGHSGGHTFGWNCDGVGGQDYSSGRRDLSRGSGGKGLNHFDRDNTCQGDVNWVVSVPNGEYTVMVDFGNGDDNVSIRKKGGGGLNGRWPLGCCCFRGERGHTCLETILLPKQRG